MLDECIRVIIFLLIDTICLSQTYYGECPEQIHLSLGNNPDEMVITWVTFSETEHSYVWYGTLTDGLTCREEGYSKKWVDDGRSKIVRYIHKVTLLNLEPMFYVYRCGSYRGISDPFIFKMRPIGTNWSPRFIIYGDMGWQGAEIFPYLQEESNKYAIDAIFHIGDIAYNMDSYDGYVGDEFLRMIQPVASIIPYMTTVGNHEQAYNFSHYKNKFSMPGHSEGLFYSFDIGPAHFVAISTEVYYFSEYGIDPLVNQYNWLLEDLERASDAENRELRPWIIFLGHRPMYCSSDTGEDCSYENNILKCCSLNSCNYGLERLFRSHGVDLNFAGHMHYYQRSWPIYNNEVFNGSHEDPYRNPGATVHIITGAAGMKSGTESASYIRTEWFPMFNNDHSYTVLHVCNNTHLHLEQISVTRGGEVIDSVWLIKDASRSAQ